MKKTVLIITPALVLAVAMLHDRIGWRLWTQGMDWPPTVGQLYPDLAFVDQTGNPFRLSSLKGKVILLEPIGMQCGACQAFCGGNTVGGLGGVTPQGDLPSLEELFPRFAGGSDPADNRIAHVQLLLYDLSNGATNAEDAQMWSEHFGAGPSKNTYVLAGSRGMLTPATYRMIPGYQLIDKDFVLRADSTGHRPTHDLYKDLLPMVPELLAE